MLLNNYHKILYFKLVIKSFICSLIEDKVSLSNEISFSFIISLWSSSSFFSISKHFILLLNISKVIL